MIFRLRPRPHLDLFRARWAPIWLRRRFPGYWTQAEVDDIERRAHEDWARFRHLFDDEE
ncbi:hypothetical protein [Nocardioides mesophilus]|uniref:Uncharacterized protein n=1 Tax=Nocardioides mesophilus TaxID=433659 RepID=A0A7G9RA71_9ACTN|nr:hypothetical protein [Nocardioides mesophilus]QNN52496.1 hypothetical protein H9L09_18810 [Nocardioides mesophilus]